MEQHFVDYLKYVGFNGVTELTGSECELCLGREFDTLADNVKVNEHQFCQLPIGCCRQCGYIMQTPRFDHHFYTWYFNNHYTQQLFGNKEPEKAFVIDQHRRGLAILNHLNDMIPRKGRLLDVGCSSGGLMIPFAKKGWAVTGTDPDVFYAGYGARKLGFEIQTVAAEDMDFPAAHFDLVIVASALEHVYDLNKVLRNIRCTTVENGLLFIETRGLDFAIYNGYFSHHYRRYFTANSLKHVLLKHGYEMIWNTQDHIMGPNRPGSMFTLARATKQAVHPEVKQRWENIDHFENIKDKLKGLGGIDE